MSSTGAGLDASLASANCVGLVSNLRQDGAMATQFAAIGERLRAYRIGRGLAADQVAEQLGVSRAAVYRIEAGEVV